MTTQVHLDCSVFSTSSAVGRFAGTMEFDALPGVGEKIAFPVTLPGDCSAEFLPHIAVESVLHVPAQEGSPARTLLELEDLTFPTDKIAKAVLAEFEKLPGLFCDYWDA